MEIENIKNNSNKNNIKSVLFFFLISTLSQIILIGTLWISKSIFPFMRVIPYTSLVTSDDHFRELFTASTAGGQFIADRLVSFPPRPPGGSNDTMLIRGRNLYKQTKLIRASDHALFWGFQEFVGGGIIF